MKANIDRLGSPESTGIISLTDTFHQRQNAIMQTNRPPILKLATEIPMGANRDAGQRRYFLFPLDGGKDFCYRSRVSFNAFANSTKERCYRPNATNAELLYHFQSPDEFKGKNERFAKSMGRTEPEPVEIIQVGSLWEFYKAIGYDYKSKNGLRPSLPRPLARQEMPLRYPYHQTVR